MMQQSDFGAFAIPRGPAGENDRDLLQSPVFSIPSGVRVDALHLEAPAAEQLAADLGSGPGEDARRSFSLPTASSHSLQRLELADLLSRRQGADPVPERPSLLR